VDCNEVFLLCTEQEGMYPLFFFLPKRTREKLSGLRQRTGFLYPHVQDGIRAVLNMQQAPRGLEESSTATKSEH
jgi:hypothetical protein